MKTKIYNFKDSLKKGQEKEKEFCSIYADLELLDGRNADMKIKSSGKLIEIKHDFYDLDKTGNLAIETISYGDKVGGPFQSQKKNIDFYIYRFVKCNTIFVFYVSELVDFMETNMQKYKEVIVRNDTYNTKIRLVPAKDLEPIAMTMEDILCKK